MKMLPSANIFIVCACYSKNIMFVLVENRYYPMFSIFSPTQCDICGSKLHINSHHTRFLLSRYGTISLNVTYWLCPTCKKHYHDQVIGVQGSANYSSEYYD